MKLIKLFKIVCLKDARCSAGASERKNKCFSCFSYCCVFINNYVGSVLTKINCNLMCIEHAVSIRFAKSLLLCCVVFHSLYLALLCFACKFFRRAINCFHFSTFRLNGLRKCKRLSI